MRFSSSVGVGLAMIFSMLACSSAPSISQRSLQEQTSLPTASGSPAAAVESPEQPPAISTFSSTLTEANVTKIDHAITSAARILRESLLPSGQFVYRHELDGKLEKSGSYNIVRHAGAIYSLAMVEQDFPSSENRKAIQLASAFLISSSLREVQTRSAEPVSAIYSVPEIEMGRRRRTLQAGLGGTALGLVALIMATEVNPETIPIDQLRSLARFLVMMQKPTGAFYSRFNPAKGPDESFQSLYYPGEAILALALMHQRDPQPIWFETAMQGIRFLAQSRRGKTDVPSDNWALIATEQLLKEKSLKEDDRRLMIDHARWVTRRNINDQIKALPSPLYGCFTSDARTTPTATHLEGLLAAATYLPSVSSGLDSSLELAQSITAGIGFLLDSQQSAGAYEGAIPMVNLKAVALLNAPPIKNASTVRIDYVQHALSGFLRYRRIYLPLQKRLKIVDLNPINQPACKRSVTSN